MICPLKFNQFAIEKQTDFRAAQENAECSMSNCAWWDSAHGHCSVAAIAYELMQSRTERK